MPSGKLVVAKTILPLVPPQVVGLVATPASRVGDRAAVKVFVLLSVAIQSLLVMEKLVYVPVDKPLTINVLEVIVTVLGLPAPVKVSI